MYFLNMDLSYLSKYNTEAKKVIGNWGLISSLFVAIAVSVLCNLKMANVIKTLGDGVQGSLLAIMNTASGLDTEML